MMPDLTAIIAASREALQEDPHGTISTLLEMTNTQGLGGAPPKTVASLVCLRRILDECWTTENARILLPVIRALDQDLRASAIAHGNPSLIESLSSLRTITQLEVAAGLR